MPSIGSSFGDQRKRLPTLDVIRKFMFGVGNPRRKTFLVYFPENIEVTAPEWTERHFHPAIVSGLQEMILYK